MARLHSTQGRAEACHRGAAGALLLGFGCCHMYAASPLLLQDDKERLRAQLALASQGSGASEARLAEKEEALAQLQ